MEEWASAKMFIMNGVLGGKFYQVIVIKNGMLKPEGDVVSY